MTAPFHNGGLSAREQLYRAEMQQARRVANEVRETSKMMLRILEVAVSRLGGSLEVTSAEMDAHLSEGYEVEFHTDESGENVKVLVKAPESEDENESD